MLGAGFARRSIADSTPRIVWNASASAPVGFWLVHTGGVPDTGAMVLVRTPASVVGLAAARHYIPATIPMLKHVAAASGDTVCAIGPRISIDGRFVAVRMRADPIGRSMPWWNGCQHLSRGSLFLLNARSNSFDGRYFGPVDTSTVLGTVTPLWLR